jgi:hypothetical protein
VARTSAGSGGVVATKAAIAGASTVPCWLEPASAGAAFGDGVGDGAAGSPQVGDLGIDAVNHGFQAPELAGFAGLPGVVGAEGERLGRAPPRTRGGRWPGGGESGSPL